MSKKNLKSTKNNMQDLREYQGLSKEEQKYLKQFYREYYMGTSKIEKEPILTADEHIKDANRRSNSLYRDAMNATMNQNKLHFDESEQRVMEEASDEIEWEDAFSIGGYELAVQHIFDQAVRDIDESDIDTKTVLSQFYIKMDRLRKLSRRVK